ncbi:MFS transporter [Pseudomonas marginalis]|uniref:MFS transporter n=1 Tax=Pseudomonas marginalis TaxID=298 RepID=UPI0009B9BF6B|nr:MFS transporter [Pseudomonas marginalis]
MHTHSHATQDRPRPASVSWNLLAAIVLFAAITPTILMTAPAVAAQLGAQWQLSPSQIGDLFSVELGAMSLATLPALWWLRRVNWRLAALAAAGLFIAANLLSMLADSYTHLLTLRFASALAGGSLMIICLASAATTANPSRVYGLWVMGQLVVGAIGLAVLPGLFERYGLGACYLILAGLMTLLLPLARSFPNAAPAPQAAETARVSGSRWHAALGVGAVLAFYISLGGVWTFIGALGARVGISPQDSGEVLAVATVMGIAGAACASLIGPRLSRLRLLLVGYALMAAAVLLLLGQPTLMRFALAALLFKFTWTFILPLILACLADLDHSGKLMNASNLVIGGGLAIGPAIAGRLIEISGSFTALLIGGAVITLLSLAMILASRPKPVVEMEPV